MNSDNPNKEIIHSVKYYSGLSPVPLIGDLRLAKEGVYFLHEQEENFISYQEIVSITAIGGNVHVEINMKKIKTASRRL